MAGILSHSSSLSFSVLWRPTRLGSWAPTVFSGSASTMILHMIFDADDIQIHLSSKPSAVLRLTKLLFGFLMPSKTGQKQIIVKRKCALNMLGV